MEKNESYFLSYDGGKSEEYDTAEDVKIRLRELNKSENILDESSFSVWKGVPLRVLVDIKIVEPCK